MPLNPKISMQQLNPLTYNNKDKNIIDLLRKGYSQNAAQSNPYSNSDLEKFYGNKQSILDQNYQNELERLQNRYNALTSGFGSDYAQGKAEARNVYERLMKYIPDVMKINGYGEGGLSEGALVSASNNYLNALAELKKNYSNQKASAQNQLNEDTLDLEKDYNEDKYNLEGEKQLALDNDRANQQSNFDTILQNMLANATYEDDGMTLSLDSYTKLKNYIDENKGLLGNNLYNNYLTDLNSRQAITPEIARNDIATLLESIDKAPTPTEKLRRIAEAFEYSLSNQNAFSSGEYNQINEVLQQGTVADYDNYYVQGLGSGRENDDIDITIGSKHRDMGTEYDLKCGSAIKDEASTRLLNKLTTGDMRSSPKKKTLCVVGDNMYVYTDKGWVNVVADNSKKELTNAIKDFKAKRNSTK